MSKKVEEKIGRKSRHYNPIRLSKPRIDPLPKSEWNDEVKAQLKNMKQDAIRRVPNIFTTLARHPKLLKRWLVFGRHITIKSSLPPRVRELLILRIGWLCRAEYELSQHLVIGRACGFSDEEFQRIIDGPDAKGWDPFEAALIRAVDELHDDAFISDSTWKVLSEHYNTHQLLDVIFTVGQYNLICMALNTLGVQVDEGLKSFQGEFL